MKKERKLLVTIRKDGIFPISSCRPAVLCVVNAEACKPNRTGGQNQFCLDLTEGWFINLLNNKHASV